MQNPYSTLRITKSATADEIRSAYRALVLEYHPDRNSDPSAIETFISITQAYEILSDPRRKRDYDEAERLRQQTREAIYGPNKEAAPTPPKKPAGVTKHALVVTEIQRMTVQYSKGNFDGAKRIAERVLTLDSHQGLPYAILGDIARSRGHMREATKNYAYAVQMDPTNDVYMNRYVELLGGAHQVANPRAEAGPRQVIGVILIAMSLILSPMCAAVFPGAKLGAGFPWVSQVSLSSVVSLVVGGLILGLGLGLGKFLNKFSTTVVTVVGKLDMVLMIFPVVLVNFWAGLLVYFWLGAVKGSIGRSGARLLGSSGLLLFATTLGCVFAYRQGTDQMLMWLGNLAYMGCLVGWALSELVLETG